MARLEMLRCTTKRASCSVTKHRGCETMKKDDLLDLMERLGGRITTKAARDAGYPNSLLDLLLDEGAIKRESRGVYALVSVPLDDFAVLTLRWPRLVFSHGSALYLLGLSDRVPIALEVSCPRGYRSPALIAEYPGTTVHNVAPKNFGLGLTRGLSPTGTPVALYDAERCFCDMLVQRRRGRADLQLLSDVVNGYMRSESRNLPKLARYADALGVADELRVYTEVM